MIKSDMKYNKEEGRYEFLLSYGFQDHYTCFYIDPRDFNREQDMMTVIGQMVAEQAECYKESYIKHQTGNKI